MHTLILCDGEQPARALLQRQVAAADLVVATDGAAAWARAAGVMPQVVIGDFDSLSEVTGDWELVHAGAHDQQDNSDSEKAVLLALDRGATEIVLLGATQQRLDHTLANVWLAATYRGRARVTLVDDYGACEVVGGCRTLRVAPGTILSLVPLTGDVVVRTEGLKWQLDGPLAPGSRGLSNEAVNAEVTVNVTAGLVAVVVVSHRT
ncbi:MAG: thiamine diphosphokinase [Armatimonadetes bacterium]|nr:thiamine diphosphokinase [Armatimonadota bacterium]